LEKWLAKITCVDARTREGPGKKQTETGQDVRPTAHTHLAFWAKFINLLDVAGKTPHHSEQFFLGVNQGSVDNCASERHLPY
jgi:hypothetical protein